MPKTTSGLELPPEYKAPTDKVQSFSVADFEFRFKLNQAGLVDYQVSDKFEKTVDSNICTVAQFECAMAALCEGALSGPEYEEAERAQGSIVRWIP